MRLAGYIVLFLFLGKLGPCVSKFFDTIQIVVVYYVYTDGQLASLWPGSIMT